VLDKVTFGQIFDSNNGFWHGKFLAGEVSNIPENARNTSAAGAAASAAPTRLSSNDRTYQRSPKEMMPKFVFF
jgi:hypothetical protein